MKTTTLGYIEYNNHYLMLYRDERNASKNDGSVGKWLGIGGKLKPRETADECFIREVLEETGILLQPNQIKRRGIIDFISDCYSDERMFLYTASVDSDFFDENCHEGSLSWIEIEKVSSLPMWEGDKIFLERLISNEMNIYLTLRYEQDCLKEALDYLALTDIPEEALDELGKASPLSYSSALDLSQCNFTCPKTSDLSIYAISNEAQLLHYNEPAPGIFLAETPQVIRRALNAGYEIISILAEPRGCYEAISFAECEKTMTTSIDNIRKLTGFNLTMGMVAAMRRKENALTLDSKIEKIVVLENVTNPTNVGAIIRSAVALGAQALILTKGCSDPLYRRSVRVSLGNIFSIPYVCLDDLNTDWISALHQKGFSIISMALHDNSVFLGDEALESLPSKRAVVLGNESTGILDSTLENSDLVVKIPMESGVDSLNVAAASAIAFWELFKS